MTLAAGAVRRIYEIGAMRSRSVLMGTAACNGTQLSLEDALGREALSEAPKVVSCCGIVSEGAAPAVFGRDE